MSPLDALATPLGQRLTWTLVHFLWQGIAAALLVVAALSALRPRRAGGRYAVCLAGLLLMAACPLLTLAVFEVPATNAPQPRVGSASTVGPDGDPSSAQSPADRIGPGAATEGAPESSSPEGVRVIVFDSGAPRPAAEVSDPGVALAPEGASAGPHAMPSPAVSQGQPEPPGRSRPRATTLFDRTRALQPYVLLGWMAGVVLLSGRILLGLIGVGWLRRSRTPLSADWAQRASQLGRRLGLGKAARAFTSAKVREAIVVGVWRPMVLLPASWLMEMTPEALEAVIAHELAHIRRWDLWVNLLQRLVETLLFYHPAVWWLSRRIRLEREMCCDELAVAATGWRIEYANVLELVGRKRLAGTWPTLPASAHRHTKIPAKLGAGMGGERMALLHRVRNVLGLAPLAQRGRWWPVGLAALAVPLVIWLVSAKGPTTGPPEAAAAEEPPVAEAPAEKPAVSFESVSATLKPFEMFNQQTEHVTIAADGSCVYRIEERPAIGDQPRRPPARLTCKLRPEKLTELESLLEKTAWLTAPGWEGRAMHTHPAERTFTVVRDGNERTITCHGERPEPYKSLIWFFRGVAYQENLLYRLNWVAGRDRQDACREIASHVEALSGKSGRAFPLWDIDYSQYLPTFTRVVRNPYGVGAEEVMAAIQVVTFLRADSEFEYIARLRHDRDANVRRVVAEAVADFGGQRAVPVLVDMAPSTPEAIWGLIRLGDIAVPELVKLIEKGTQPNDVTSEKVIRQYLEHWNELPGPVDPRIVAAVRKALAMPSTRAYRTEYHEGFLDWVEKEPVAAGNLWCRIDYKTVYCPPPTRFIHGWYAVVDGKIVAHGAAAAPEPGVGVFTLPYEATAQGGEVVLKLGWEPPRGPAGAPRVPVVQTAHIEIPTGTEFRAVDHYREKHPLANEINPTRVTNKYRTLWSGQAVRGGEVVKEIFYVARVAGADDPVQTFVPPGEPAATEFEPPKPPRQVAFGGMDLTNAPRVADAAVLHDLQIAWRNHAIKAAGGTPRDQSQTAVIYESELNEATGEKFFVFNDPAKKVFYICANFRQPGKRTEVAWYGPFEGDPREKLDLPGPARPATKRAAKRGATLRQRLAARPAPDLDGLVARSAPDYAGPDATESFFDILKLRESRDAKAVPVLEQILAAHRGSTRSHGFAAAQALFSIGTPEAHRILSSHLLTGEYRAAMAIDCTYVWEMPEPQRSRFIEQYLLKSVSRELEVKLEVQAPAGGYLRRLGFVVTLRNVSDKPIHIVDQQAFLGRMLYFRDAGGRFNRSMQHSVRISMAAPEWIELRPGQTRQYQITAQVKRADAAKAPHPQLARGSTVLLETPDIHFYFDKPGRFDVFAMFEVPPLTEEQKKDVAFDDAWSGRAVSEPVQVDIVDPDVAIQAQPGESSRPDTDGGTDSNDAAKVSDREPSGDVQTASAAPSSAKRGGTLRQRLAARPAPDLDDLVARSAPDYAGPDAMESVDDILKLRELRDAKAVPVLEQILAAHRGSTRYHGFAAAQALFSIGTPEAHRILSSHLLTGEYRADMAIDCTYHWEMPEPQRSRFIEQYLLKSVSRELEVKLEVQAPAGGYLRRLGFVVTLRNVSDKPIHIIDQGVYLGRMLYFRDAGGRFSRSMQSYLDYEAQLPERIELGPGQTRQYQITARVRPADMATAPDPRVARGSTVVLETPDIRYYFKRPGRFEVFAMFEVPPLTKEQKKDVAFRNAWVGRAVSKPVWVDIVDPDVAIQAQPTMPPLAATFGPQDSDKAPKVSDREGSGNVRRPSAAPRARRSATLRQRVAARPAPDLDGLVARSAPDYAGPDSTESFFDILKLRELRDAKAVPILGQILAAHRGSTRGHGFAAAQALFSIGTPEAHRILSRHLLTGEYRAAMAIDCTYYLEMPEPQRSRFMEQYLLNNVSQDLELKLQVQAPAGGDKRRLDFLVTLRNVSDKPFRIMDQKGCLYFRDAGGRFGLSMRDYLHYGMWAPGWIELGPGQTRGYRITAGVTRTDPAKAPHPQAARGSTVLLPTQEYYYYIDKPGQYDVFAMFEAAPLTEEQKSSVSFDDAWTGRAVSKPIQVNIADPRTPAAADSHPPEKANPAPDDAGAQPVDRCEGPLEFDKDIPVRLQVGKAYGEFAVQGRSIRFTKPEGKVEADLRLALVWVLEATWRVKVALLDAAGEPVGEAESEFATSVAIRRRPGRSVRDLHFSLGEWRGLSGAKTFRITVEQVPKDATGGGEPAESGASPPSGSGQAEGTGSAPPERAADPPAQSDLSLEARVVGIDGKPVQRSSITFWKAVDPTTLEPPETGWAPGFEAPQVWHDRVSGKTWKPFHHFGTSDRATVEELTPGQYRVTAYRGQGYPTTLGISDVIQLDGSTKSTLVTVPIQDGPSLSITVVDARTGEPIDFPMIRLVRSDGLAIGRWSGGWDIRPRDNRHTFEHLAPGDYTLEVSKRAYQFGDPDYLPQGEPMAVQLSAGHDRQITVKLNEVWPSEEEAAKRWPWAVTGTVTDAEGRGMEGVTIRAHCGVGTLWQQGHTQTNGSGKYTLRFGPGGRTFDEKTKRWRAGLQAATISAFKPGYCEKDLYRQGGLMMADEMPPEGNAWGAKPDEVILPGKPKRLDFVIVPAAVLDGTLLDEKGKPIADKHVSLIGKQSWPSTNVLAAPNTDAQGRFHIDPVPTGLKCHFEYGGAETREITFEAPGRYEVKLRVTQDSNTGKASLEIVDLAKRADAGGAAANHREAEPKSKTAILEDLLQGAPVSTGYKELEIFEKVPGMGHRLRKDVVRKQISLGTGTLFPMAETFYLPAKKVYYVQFDPAGASTLHYYGPFDGDPANIHFRSRDAETAKPANAKIRRPP